MGEKVKKLGKAAASAANVFKPSPRMIFGDSRLTDLIETPLRLFALLKSVVEELGEGMIKFTQEEMRKVELTITQIVMKVGIIVAYRPIAFKQ